MLNRLVDQNNSVLVIEHNLDVIKTADWVIDLGPEGGAGGGRIVAAGTPEEIAACEASHTGQFLRAVFECSEPRAFIRERVRTTALPLARRRWQEGKLRSSESSLFSSPELLSMQKPASLETPVEPSEAPPQVIFASAHAALVAAWRFWRESRRSV